MDEEGEKMLGSFSGSGGMIMMGGREPGGYGEWWSPSMEGLLKNEESRGLCHGKRHGDEQLQHLFLRCCVQSRRA